MKDTYKYLLKVSNNAVYVGITKDPERRIAEHRQDKKFDKMVIIGGVSTREGAERWEADRIETYMKNHNGKKPKYNKTTTG